MRGHWQSGPDATHWLAVLRAAPRMHGGSSVDSSAGSPAEKFQCQGWLPYLPDPPSTRLNRRNCQGTSTHLQQRSKRRNK